MPLNRLKICTLLCVAFAVPRISAAQDSLGVIRFANSGSEAAQQAFLKGVLLLHSFEYESAAESFRQAESIDPSFALAYWGEALAHFHLLWQEEDVPAARVALARLAPTPDARRAAAPTERERLYLDAVERLAGPGPKPERLNAYVAAMGRLAKAYPDDLDARALYALSILGTCDGVRDVPTYMRAAAVAEEVFTIQPRHPGAVHYLIHAYDDPVHAPLGLRAAHVYADIAPAAPHALHMPSHIFLALGDWERVVASNIASSAAARAKLAAGGGDGLGARNHALYWLAYALVQLERWDEARDVVTFLTHDADSTANRGTQWHAIISRADMLVDSPSPDREMIRAAAAVDSTRGQTAIASYLAAELAASRVNDASLTASLPRPRFDEDDSDPKRIMQLERAALQLVGASAVDSAVTLLQRATAIEDAMPIDFGPPIVVKPSHELLGEVLLKAGRAEQAAAEFRRALQRTPNRTRPVQGLKEAEQLARRGAT